MKVKTLENGLLRYWKGVVWMLLTVFGGGGCGGGFGGESVDNNSNQ